MGLHPAERVREYRAKGYWNDDMIDALLRERVEVHGDIPAITDPLNRDSLLDGPFRALTWPQLDEEVSRLAQVLLDEGIGTGDVVGVQLPNTVEIAVAFLAIVRIGAIVAPFPVQYRAWELTHLGNVAQVRAFLTASRIGSRPAAAELAGLRPQLPSLRLGGGVRGRAGRPDGGRGRPVRAGRPPGRASRPTRTTASRSAGRRGRRARPRACSGRTTTGWPCAPARWRGPDLTDADVLLNPFPMVNMAGINGMFLPWLKVGGLLVQHHPFDLATFLRQISRAPGHVHVRAARAAHRAAAQRGAAGADRHLLAAHPRLRLDAAGAQPAAGLARHVRHRDHQLLRLQRGHRAARHAEGHPRPGGARAVLPAVRRPATGSSRWPAPRWRGSWTRRPGPRSPRRACPASCASPGPACSPGTCRPAACPTRSTRTATSGPGTSSRSPATTWSTCTTSTGPRTWWSAAG